MKSTVLLVFLSLLAPRSLLAQDKVLFAHQETGTYPLLDNHVSSLMSVSRDTLICVWFGGTTEGATDNRILSSFSYDGGANWQIPLVLFDSPGDTLFRDPHLHRHGDTLILICNVQVGTGSVISAFDNYLAYAHSLDHGKSWSSMKRINVNTSVGKIRIVAPFNEGISLEGYDAFGVHWREEGKLATHVSVLLADFPNDTFFLRGDLQTTYRIAEPALIDYGNELILYLRTDQGFIQYSKSDDHGYSWSMPINTALPNPYSLSAIKKMAGDSLLIVWNNDRLTRNYLSIGISGKSDLSDLAYRHLVNIKQSPFGQVSYPSVIKSDSGSYLLTYTNRKDFGRDSLNRLIVRGDIHFHRFNWKETERILNNPSPIAQLASPRFVNDIIEIENRLYYCGGKAFLSILTINYDSIASIPLMQTPYELNSLAWDSTANALICVGNGGWYVRYLIDQKIVTHQKRFDELGAYNNNAILADDSGHYVVSLNGDVGLIVNPDDPAVKLWNNNGLNQKAIVRIGTSIQTCGQNLSISRYEKSSNGIVDINLSQSSTASFETIKKVGLDRYLVCGERGVLAIQVSDSVVFPFNLRDELALYNYIGIGSVSDSVKLVITNQDMAILVHTFTFESVDLRLLPNNQIGRKVLDRDTVLHIVTETGRVYSFSKTALLEIFKKRVNPTDQKNQHSHRPDKIWIYPNPAGSFVNVKSDMDILSLSVFDIQGRKLNVGYTPMIGLTSLDMSVLQLDLSLVQPGIYILKIVLSNLETKLLWLVRQ